MADFVSKCFKQLKLCQNQKKLPQHYCRTLDIPVTQPPVISSKNAGFSLVEMVVAASIFAMISVASYAAISSVLDARQAINTKRVAMSDLQRTHALLKNDIRYALNRSVRNELGDKENPLLIDNEGELIRLTTYYPAAGQTGRLKRVAWELKDKNLWRHEFTSLDRVSDVEKKQRKIAEKIEEITLAYYVLEEEKIQ